MLEQVKLKFPSPRGAMGSLIKGIMRYGQLLEFPSPRGAMGSLIFTSHTISATTSRFRPLAGQWVP